jgi:uncharacterized protein (DUF608 family)
LVGAGAATALVAPQAWTAVEPTAELAAWKRALHEPAPPRRYLSHIHTDARLHLGGIGTGNFELGVDGQFTTWQLFNTLQDGHVPFHFGVKAGTVAKLLQTAGGPDAPRVRQIEMTGEYPFADLKFRDPDLPVTLELSAFTPFAPLDARLSSLPVAFFLFRVSNPTRESQSVSLAAFMQNPVGYDAHGPLAGAHHPNFGGNLNECFATDRAKGLLLRAEPGREPTLDQPVQLYALQSFAGLHTPPQDRPKNLALEFLDRLPTAPTALPDPPHTVIWLEDAPADLAEPLLRAARDAVLAGATLVFAGQTQPLLASFAHATGGKAFQPTQGLPDIVFEDFEQGYDRWTREGDCFGPKPAAGTLPNQQRVSGFLGRGLVNTYLEGDGTTGRLISKPFTIERNYIRFLVGGGAHPDTQMRLVVGGKTVRSAAGRNLELLEPASWEVREFQGQTAHLEIVDQNRGGWGHINVDQIEFADRPANTAVFTLLEELLPARFSGVRPPAQAGAGQPRRVEFDGLQLREGARTPDRAVPGLDLLAERTVGKGRVLLAAGPLLDPAEAAMVNPRQRAYAALCGLVGARYEPPRGPLPMAAGFGTLALATLAGDPTAHCAHPDCDAAWADFAAHGRFLPLSEAKPGPPTESGRTVTAALASSVTVPAGASVEIPFLLAWHYPNKYSQGGAWMGCHYTQGRADAQAVAQEAAAHFDSWRERTARFRRSLYDSTLPYWLLDCLTSQAAIMRHVGVVFRIANGDVYGWEGSNGCCQPTCTHVWGYEQTLARLFPDLEKDMRRIDFKHQQRPDGGVNNRTDVPSPPRPTGEQPFADGHASCILKAWREALNHPDDAWLREYWPHTKRGVEYLIARDAATSGGQPTGILNDDQWNTYDEALHGVTTFIGTYYLAALRAGEEWARRVADQTAADRFHTVFQKGQERLLALCWNGEYFHQHLPDYLTRAGEVGPGCMADQLIGQWWAHQLGLGYLLPKDKVRAALKAVFVYNWRPDLTGWKHMPRAFAGDRDKGLIICTWPKGGRPANVMLYSDEVWTGIEYQVAAHMLYEGLLEESLAIVKGARDRYDGVPRPPIPRNPWNEIECGGHYARAMSSWSLLLAASGYEYDGPAQALRFTPRLSPHDFKSFFCGPEGWGSLRQLRQDRTQRNEIAVSEGAFALTRLTLAAPPAPVTTLAVKLGDRTIAAALSVSPEEAVVTLAQPVRLRAGESLGVTLS